MKIKKSFLAISAMTVACTTQAAVWDISMTLNHYAPQHLGTINTSMAGTWDDSTNAGTWHGYSSINSVLTLDVTYTQLYSQTFTMDETTGLGGELLLEPGCTDGNVNNRCTFFLGPVGKIKNTAINPTDLNEYKKQFAFTPVSGWTGQWATQVYRAEYNEDGEPVFPYSPHVMNITLMSQAPAVPTPATAALFASGLLGLAGARRKRKSDN